MSSTDLGLYGSGNPNYPVTKVNNKTGEVSLTATDLNADPQELLRITVNVLDIATLYKPVN